ncbi:MAG: hypothetical protein KKC75_04800 [Nanoarchaeota archaeon]|nr:hypothetical protein [Nanoarchaeota archaeon]MBU1005088.1 hypothetical protein [Nanoarchaeota archaeon]MBU1946430.1 hypothetical protein [Nanoarchaeota archaeon]
MAKKALQGEKMAKNKLLKQLDHIYRKHQKKYDKRTMKDKDTLVMKQLDTNTLVSEFNRLRSKTKKLTPARIEEEINAARRKA